MYRFYLLSLPSDLKQKRTNDYYTEIMDKRLKLNRKQKALVNKLAKLFAELKKENVGIVTNWDTEYGACDFNGLFFFNNTEVLGTDVFEVDGITNSNIEGYSEESSWDEAGDNEIWYTPNSKELDYLPLNITLNNYNYDWFSVLLERTEETDIFYRKQEKAKKLAPLIEKLDKANKKMQKYENAVSECENSIHRLEEKGVSQEIIDEEKASLESNKKQVDKIQDEIKAINSEIRKVKALRVNK